MQSSLWKLLTAAGIIGIGTLVVLEVRNRLPMPGSSTDNGSVQVSGTDQSVTPDDSTELDQVLALADGSQGAASAPVTFDHPITGTGNPAPPEDSSTFFGAVDRTVRKDDLTDKGSPFAMDEPAFTMDEPATGPTDSGTTIAEDQSSTIQPVGFEPGKDSKRQQPTRSASRTGSSDESKGMFPNDEPAKTSASVAAPNPVTSSALQSGSEKPASAEKSKIMFFSNGGNKEASAKDPQPQAESNSASLRTASVPVTGASLARSPQTESVARPNQTTKPASAANGDEQLPEMFLQEPVPEISFPVRTTPPAKADPSVPDSRPFEGGDVSPFSEDTRPTPAPSPSPSDSGVPRQPAREVPARSPAPGRATEPLFFEPDTLSATPPSKPATTNPVGDAETLPFTEDEPEMPPFGADSPRPAPVDAPVDDFPAPQYPSRPPKSDRGGLDSEFPEPFGESDSNVPDRTEPLPLPSADPPVRPRRTDRENSLPTSDSTGRSVSQVMRPQLTIQKRAPDSATVGVSHDYTIVVTNEGDSPAWDVVVQDELGGAADFVSAVPAAKYDRATGEMTWNFAELPAGRKQEIKVRIKPTGEGTLDGIATVRFKAQVKSATVITAPKLELDLTGPDEVKVGDEVPLLYTIRNSGSGDASSVVLRSVLPPGLKHPEGGDLEYEIELLRAGEEQQVDLTVVAAEPGDRILVAAEVTASGIAAAKSRMEIEIVGAQLKLERHGPERRYVGRSAMYQNIVLNDSKFEATNAIVVEEVPEGMRFVSASNGGVYNPDNRRIRWTIPRLAPGKQAVLDVELVAETAGRMETIVEVTENAGFRTPLTENTTIIVEDLHNLTADISRQNEPVAIGDRFGFTITIDNRGTAVARNVEMSVQVPAEIRVLAAGTRQVPGKLLPGNIVRYNTVLEIQPNASMTFQLTLQGEQPVKNARVQASLKYAEMPEPLIVSESVTVFDDRP
jgi:uncharacterized repeat protein (TIGR01451 family)